MVTVKDRPATTTYTSAHTAARAAVQLGLSVIPLRDKRPALVTWKAYQRRPPTPDELRQWFIDEGHSAYGILCGRLSRLAVLDLDDPALAEAFLIHFPHLADTFTVQSGQRHTPHLYWRVDFPVRSCKFPQADLQGEGKYVVGPGSIIHGKRWEVVLDKPIRDISQVELADVLAYLERTTKPPAAPFSQRMAPRSKRSQADYQAIYASQVAANGGRNDSLFFTTCLARDDGHPQAWTEAALADIHAHQLPQDRQRQEQYTQRLQEACCTIASAYSRPPRPNTQRDPTSRLSNALREAFLQQPDGTATLRTLEGLWLKGMRPGDRFTRQGALALLSGVVGDYSIRKALGAQSPVGTALFTHQAPGPQAIAGTETGPDGRQRNASLSPGQNQQAPVYTYPDSTELCKDFGVTPQGGDPIHLADLVGAKAYREALQREFIHRRPGRYHQALFAARLGVSDRTIRRYHREIPIHSLPQYIERPIYWSCIDILPLAEAIERFNLALGGHFLEDETGKRYPCKQEIACKLLSQGHHVTYKRQTASFYYYGDHPPPEAFAAVRTGTGLPLAQQVEAVQQAQERRQAPSPLRQLTLPGLAPCARETLPTVPAARASPGVSQPATQSTPSQRNPARRSRRRHYQQSLADQVDEQLAQQLHTELAQLSLGNARQLVDLYGRALVRKLFKRVQYKARRGGGIANPAGYLITALRVEAKRQQGSAPDYQSQLPRKPRALRRPLSPAENDPLWQSDAYQQWRATFFATTEGAEAELPY